VSADALLHEAATAGVTLRLDQDGKVKGSGIPSPALLARLRAHKAELIRLLRGDLGPHWTEVDHWRSRQREAMATREGRAAVLREWAAVAGGVVDPEGKLRLSANLRKCLASAELHALARDLGMEA
jgi:hypothetical protein